MSGRLSVVIVATESPEAVQRFFESPPDSLADWIVVATFARPSRFPPNVEWIETPHQATVPGMRRIGFEACRGDVVAFTEDSVIPSPGWTAAFSREDLATGPVVPEPGGSHWDRAVFVFEYGYFLTPGSGRLAGNNFAASRQIIERLGDEIHEHEISGIALKPVAERPGAVVRFAQRVPARRAIADRFRFGRDYGRRRWAERPAWLAPIAAPLIAMIQMRRIFLSLIQPEFREFRGCWPALIVLVAAWSLGESAGWARWR